VLFTFVREYAKNQQHKRDLEARRQEQELRWKEEDRARRLAESAKNAANLGDHAEALRRLAGVSLVTLRCHEDTWTFMAQAAFGQWEPHWVKSTLGSLYERGPSSWEVGRFTVEPNLPSGRIDKKPGGMQDVLVSGHNLVRILDTLRAATGSSDLTHGCRARTLYEKITAIASVVDLARPSGQSTGVVVPIGDSLGEQPPPTLRGQVSNRAAPPPPPTARQRAQTLPSSRPTQARS